MIHEGNEDVISQEMIPKTVRVLEHFFSRGKRSFSPYSSTLLRVGFPLTVIYPWYLLGSSSITSPEIKHMSHVRMLVPSSIHRSKLYESSNLQGAAWKVGGIICSRNHGKVKICRDPNTPKTCVKLPGCYCTCTSCRQFFFSGFVSAKPRCCVDMLQI